jgi:hypothetical protein
MTWLHEPLISPAVGFYCLLGVAVVYVLVAIVQRAMRDDSDPFQQPYGDQ